jgi:3-oxoacyl-[acyl-carrier-protein] synthase-3
MVTKALARIVALGSYLPEKVLKNSDLETLVDTTDEWILSRTGISERRLSAEGEFTSDMGAQAAQRALDAAKIAADDIGLIIMATMTPDYTSSSTAAIVQAKIGATKAAAMDVQAACTGFLYALSMAKAYVEAGMYSRVLVIAAEKMSAFIDYTDRSTCILFGDGAAAAVVAAEGSGLAVKAISLGSDGTLVDLATIPAGGTRLPPTAETVAGRLHYFRMDGREIFKHAVRRMTSAANECLALAGLNPEDLSWLVPHQANMRIIDAIAKGFHASEQKVYKTVHKYGNTSASSIPLALYDLVHEHPITEGQHILLVAFGAGLTWGAAVLTQVSGGHHGRR